MKKIKGNDDDNVITGKKKAELILGLGGNDTLDGGKGNDKLIGGIGDDTLLASVGKDVFDGSKGIDLIDFANVDAGVKFNMMKKTVSFVIDGVASSIKHKNMDGASGSEFNDVFHGNARNNDLFGEYGNDKLYGGAGNDVFNGYWGDDKMYGEDGNDRFLVQYGNDKVDGGKGSDTLDFYFANTYGITIDLGTGTVNYYRYGSTGTGVTTFTSIENVLGSILADTITGDGKDNYLSGDSGEDTIDAKSGNDMLDGGLGDDTLTGGSGKNGFMLTTAVTGIENIDTITDFVVAKDSIYLDDKIFTALTGTGAVQKTELFTFKAMQTNQFQASSGTDPANGDVRVIYDSDTGIIYYDADGNDTGDPVAIAQLDPGLALTAADFFVL